MNLKMSTCYAIRIIIYLSEKECLISSKELSKKLIIPQGYLFKVLKILQDKDFVDSYIGAGGGFILKKDPRDIVVFDIVDATEISERANNWLENREYQENQVAAINKARCFYKQLQVCVDDMLKRMTVQDLIEIRAD